MAEAARSLNHPAAYAKVECYRRHHERQVELEVDRQAIIAEIEHEDNTLGGIKSCMEGWGLHE